MAGLSAVALFTRFLRLPSVPYAMCGVSQVVGSLIRREKPGGNSRVGCSLQGGSCLIRILGKGAGPKAELSDHAHSHPSLTQLTWQLHFPG